MCRQGLLCLGVQTKQEQCPDLPEPFKCSLNQVEIMIILKQRLYFSLNQTEILVILEANRDYSYSQLKPRLQLSVHQFCQLESRIEHSLTKGFWKIWLPLSLELPGNGWRAQLRGDFSSTRASED